MPMANEESSDETADDTSQDQDLYRICVNWSGLLEPVDVSPYTTAEELARCICSASECALAEHKQFIFKGLLLPEQVPLCELGISHGSVLHLTLNEDPYLGREIYVKCDDGPLRTVSCGEDFYIEDIKEELSCYPEQPPPEKQRLIFAGRELQNDHTLREYNIQKPSVLLSISQKGNGRQLPIFVRATAPARDARDVPLDAAIDIVFHDPDNVDTHFWGQMLGGPDLETFHLSDIVVRPADGGSATPAAAVRGTLRRRGAAITFRPAAPLLPRQRYTVTVRSSATPRPSRSFAAGPPAAGPAATVPGLMHSKTLERVTGELTWDFYTVGYVPLRLSAVYPRPHSRVPPGAGCAAVLLRFTGPIAPDAAAAGWVTVRGHTLRPPLYHPETHTLAYPLADPLLPNEICRVRVRPDRVRGAVGGGCLLPPQPDGLLRTSTFRWKFYTAGPLSAAGGPAGCLYDSENAAAAGLDTVLRALRAGLLRPLAGGPAPGAAAAGALVAAGPGPAGALVAAGAGAGWPAPAGLQALLNPSHILAGAVDAYFGGGAEIVKGGGGGGGGGGGEEEAWAGPRPKRALPPAEGPQRRAAPGHHAAGAGPGWAGGDGVADSDHRQWEF